MKRLKISFMFPCIWWRSFDGKESFFQYPVTFFMFLRITDVFREEQSNKRNN